MSKQQPEVVIPWFNASSSNDGSCFDVQKLADGTIQTRNSNSPDQGIIEYTPAEWATFIAGAKNGVFDHTL